MIRYAPFATIKVMSIATVLSDLVDHAALNREQAFQNAVEQMLGASLAEQVQAFQANYDTLFRDIALADSISINEDYGTRPVYGIGEPTNPALVPGNVGIRVSISRLTTDNRSVADYVLKPSFWYDENLQRQAINRAQAVTGEPRNADRMFHTYLAISDVANNNSMRDMDAWDLINNYEFIEFLPVSYGRRISSENSIIFTDVEGTGKILKLRDIILTLTNAVGE